MAAFNAIFLFAICAIGFAIYCCATIPLLRYATRRKANARRSLIIGMTIILASYIALLFAYHCWATRPAAVFELAFGFAPTTDVTIHYSKQYILGDTGERVISFSANPKTVDRIVQLRFKTNLKQSKPNENGVHRFAREFSESFMHESEELQYSQSTKKAYYTWTGID